MNDRAFLMRWSPVLVAGVVLLAAVTLWTAHNFPQEYRREFYVAKAVVGILAVLLTIFHMDLTWGSLRSGAQMSRYIMLLFGAVVAGGGSFEQIDQGVTVELRNLGGFEFLLGICIAMVWSLREDRRRRCANHAATTP